MSVRKVFRLRPAEHLEPLFEIHNLMNVSNRTEQELDSRSRLRPGGEHLAWAYAEIRAST